MSGTGAPFFSRKIGVTGAGVARATQAVKTLGTLLPLLGAGPALGAAASGQPYIDRLLRTMPGESSRESARGRDGAPADREAYIREERARADARFRKRREEGAVAPEGRSYTEQLKKTLSREDARDKGEKAGGGEESYLEAERRKLREADAKAGADSGKNGAIEKVLKGDSALKLKRPGKIRFAGGFRLGVSMQRSVSAGAADAYVGFSQVYGSRWVPDLQLFGEFQPFHSEWLGSLGFVAGGGVAVYKATGSFALELPVASSTAGVSLGTFAPESAVNLQFLTLPAFVGVNYRFNLLRILRPYVQVAPTLIGYRESRSDRSGAFAGVSKALQYSAGVNVLLDFLDKKSTWDLYDTGGIKHYYLTLDYTRLQTLASAVSFDFSGVSAGLTLEF
jgi:hypothetical protein